MSITATNLTADLSASDTRMTVASGTGFPGVGTIVNNGYLVRIDNEFMLASSQPVSGTINIYQRGYDGTAAVAHDTLAKVEVSSVPSDFGNPTPGNQVNLPPALPLQQTLGEDKTFTSAEILAWGNQPRNFAITKGSACLFTLVAPSKSQDGLTLVFTSDSAFAHVMTATTLLGDAVSGSPHTTGTFAAFIGASITLQAQNGLWNVISTTGVTIT